MAIHENRRWDLRAASLILKCIGWSVIPRRTLYYTPHSFESLEIVVYLTYVTDTAEDLGVVCTCRRISITLNPQKLHSESEAKSIVVNSGAADQCIYRVDEATASRWVLITQSGDCVRPLNILVCALFDNYEN